MAEYNRYLEEQGETSFIGCIRLDEKTGEQTEVCDSHLYHDGLGGLVAGMKKAGYTGTLLPASTPRKRPPFIFIVPHTLRFLFEEFRPRKPLKWKRQNTDRNFKTYGKYTHVFSEQETETIKTKAKSENITVLALLLKALSDSTNAVLMSEPGVTRWHIPVDLRSFKTEDTSSGNHISNFICEIAPGDSAQDIHAQNLRKLKSGSFFAADFFLNLGNFPGCEKVLLNKVKGDYKKIKASPRMSGSFGYIGSWPKPGSVAPASHSNDVLIPFGNVSLMNPICATSMIWKTRLTFGLQLHSSIVSEKEEGTLLMSEIVKRVKS